MDFDLDNFQGITVPSFNSPFDRRLSKDEQLFIHAVEADEKSAKELVSVSDKHGIEALSLQTFVDAIMERMIFDGEKLSDLLEPLDLSWRDRTKKELELMEDLIPVLKKLSGGREIVGLKAYE